MAEPSAKSEQAFRTIGELAADLGVPQHILRYWETRFPQLRPLQRAGNRRYYRPADVQLAHRIHKWLNQDGYTIRGVQQLLSTGGGGERDEPAEVVETPAAPLPERQDPAFPLQALRAIRMVLAEALEEGAV